MFDPANHYEFLEELRPRFYPDTQDTGEDELMDEERRRHDEDEECAT